MNVPDTLNSRDHLNLARGAILDCLDGPDYLNFARFECVSFYGFFDTLANQVIARVAFDQKALFTATKEVMGGYATKLGKQFGSLFGFSSPPSPAPKSSKASLRGIPMGKK